MPPCTVLWKLSPDGGGGVTVYVPDCKAIPEYAINVTGVFVHTGLVTSGTTVDHVPAGTVTCAGKEAADGLLLLKLTGHPVSGAGAPKTGTTCAGAPPGPDAGD